MAIKQHVERAQPCVFLSRVDGEEIVRLLKAFKRRGFRSRDKILDELARIFCGLYRGSESLAEVLKAGLWLDRMPEMGVLPEATEGLKSVVTACFAADEQQFNLAKDQVAQALVNLLPAHAADVALRREKERQEVESLRKSFTLMLFEAKVGPDFFPVELFFKLQASPCKEQFARVYGYEPTVPGLRKSFRLSEAVCRGLREAKAAAWAAAQQRFRESIHAGNMPEKLGISKAEFNRWRADGRIPITFYSEFQKWGATLETTRHHPDEIAHITPELISAWRDADRQARSVR